MNESKSETKVKGCGECTVIRYIFRVMYVEKIVFAITDNKSVWVNGSKCLISYVNVVVLLIKILEWLLIQLAKFYVLLEQLSDYLGMQPSAMVKQYY
jgi:hypothetical protein